MNSNDRLSRAGLLNLSLVYVAWGSTYLAIRVAVRPGAGFPPFSMVFLRVVVAGLILFLVARLRRKNLRLSRRELAVLALTGLLLWVGGNGLVVWAEQYVDSGLAALVVATVPLWSALMDALAKRERPSPLLSASLLIGLGGVGLLSAPSFSSDSRSAILSILAMLLASMLWSLGASLQSRASRVENGQVRSAYQHLFGSLGLLALMILVGEPAPTPIREAWIAWAYLVVFGSIVGFTAFTTMINLLPLNVAMTYAYVNPLIAVALGAMVLGEPITPRTLLGGGLTLLGVAGVFRDRRRLARQPRRSAIHVAERQTECTGA